MAFGEPYKEFLQAEQPPQINWSGPKERFFIALCLIIIIFTPTLCLIGWMNVRGTSWEASAIQALESISDAQLSYRENNETRCYGSLEDLQNDEYIDKNFNLSNLVENYTLKWGVTNTSTVEEDIHRFTVVAIPKDNRPGFLKTFGITDERVVRTFNPFNNNVLTRITTWDPVL